MRINFGVGIFLPSGNMDANDTTDTQDLLSESDTSEAPRVGFVKNKVQAVSIYMLCDLYT